MHFSGKVGQSLSNKHCNIDILEKLIVNPDADIVAKLELVVGRGVKDLQLGGWEGKTCLRSTSFYNSASYADVNFLKILILQAWAAWPACNVITSAFRSIVIFVILRQIFFEMVLLPTLSFLKNGDMTMLVSVLNM